MAELPFDRSLATRFDALLRERFDLRAEARNPDGTHVAVKLCCEDTDLQRELSRATFRVDLRVEDELVTALERQIQVLPASAWSAPRRAQARFETELPRWQARLDETTRELAARGVKVAEVERFGRPSKDLADEGRDAIIDALFDLLELATSMTKRWRDEPRETRVARRADRTLVVLGGSARMLEPHVSTPLLRFEARDQGERYVDGYREGEGEILRLVALPAFPHHAAHADEHEALLAAASAVLVPDLDSMSSSALATGAVVVPWLERPDMLDEDDTLSLEVFRRGRRLPPVHWFRGDLDQALAALVEAPPPARPQSRDLDAWLGEGLERGLWTDPRWQPPILAERRGRHAFAQVARSGVALELMLRRFDALVALGATPDQVHDRKTFDEDGALVELPLVEAAVHGGEAAFRHLLTHVADPQARRDALARMRELPELPELLRAGDWVEGGEIPS